MRKNNVLGSLLIILLIFGLMEGCTPENSHAEMGQGISGGRDIAYVNSSDFLEKELKDDYKTIKISAVGDCTLGSDVVYNYRGSFNEYYNRFGPEYFFQEVKEEFLKDDYTIANLECALTDSRKYQDKTYVYGGKPEYAKILKEGSVEVVSLDNNHTFDYLSRGFEDTKAALRKEDVDYAYQDTVLIKETKGIKVAFISISSWSVNDAKLSSYFQKASDAGAELNIVSVHWGSNYQKNFNKGQQNLGHKLVDAGADLVLGHHPHILQGIEYYKDTYIVYSLGNFSYGGKKRLGEEKDTMIFQQEFTFLNGRKDSSIIKIIPASMSSALPINNYRPIICDSLKEKQRILNKIFKLSEGLDEGILVIEEE